MAPAALAARLVSLLIALAISVKGDCVHDAIMDNVATAIPHEERHLHTETAQEYGFEVDQHGRALQSTFSSIRIKVDTTRLFDGV
jgi:hypothetical protein